MADDPLDRDAEQMVSESLRSIPAPPMPDAVRRQLDALVHEEQRRREQGSGVGQHPLRLDLSGPALASPRQVAGTRRRPRTIRA